MAAEAGEEVISVPPAAKRACTDKIKVRNIGGGFDKPAEVLLPLRQVLVTGGTGLVGRALQSHVTSDPQPNEEWVFLSSKDGDLW